MLAAKQFNRLNTPTMFNTKLFTIQNSNWRMISSDDWVLKVMESGYRVQFLSLLRTPRTQ